MAQKNKEWEKEKKNGLKRKQKSIILFWFIRSFVGCCCRYTKLFVVLEFPLIRTEYFIDLQEIQENLTWIEHCKNPRIKHQSCKQQTWTRVTEMFMQIGNMLTTVEELCNECNLNLPINQRIKATHSEEFQQVTGLIVIEQNQIQCW